MTEEKKYIPIGKVNKHENKKKRTRKYFKNWTKKKKMKDNTNTFFYWLLVFGLLNDLLCFF